MLMQFMSRLEAINQEGHRRTREDILAAVGHIALTSIDGTPEEIVTDVEMLDVSRSDEINLRSRAHNSLLGSLCFPAMKLRYEDVVDAYPDTFKWIFYDSTRSQLQVPWSNFVDWLRMGRGIY